MEEQPHRIRHKGKTWIGRVLLVFTCFLVFGALLVAGGWFYLNPPLTLHEKAVTYGERGDVPLTLDVLQPGNPNGKGVILVVSGSWKSDPEDFAAWYGAPLLRRGFTLFAVSHISQPKVTIMDIAEDIERAVRFIRFHAANWNIDPAALGICGGSSGGHLSLCAATMGDDGLPDPSDPVDGVSSRVQAVAAFFPVTDLLNLGDSTENPGDGGPPIHYVRGFGPGAEELKTWKIIGRSISPIFHVNDHTPPILIYHGEADTLVPLDQSTRFKAAAEKTGGGPVELIVKRGRGHGYPSMVIDIFHFASFFENHL